MAFLYSTLSVLRSAWGRREYRLARAATYSRSCSGPAAASARAFCTASYAAFSRSESISELMFDPSASAMPQYAMVICGSSWAARSKERTASGWLNAYTSVSPWSKNICASALTVDTG